MQILTNKPQVLINKTHIYYMCITGTRMMHVFLMFLKAIQQLQRSVVLLLKLL